ncbi:MAG: hypothetical protein J7M03_04415, partial [Candidatus Desulfofervidaceae bacterium]|nr:hypothetical protein [Candidatus Desulfofervidaceae bacterium]
AVTNVAGYSTQSVVNMTFAMLFYLLTHLRYYDDYVKNGHYAQSPIFTHLDKPFWELYGKSVGLDVLEQEPISQDNPLLAVKK